MSRQYGAPFPIIFRERLRVYKAALAALGARAALTRAARSLSACNYRSGGTDNRSKQAVTCAVTLSYDLVTMPNRAVHVVTSGALGALYALHLSPAQPEAHRLLEVI